MWEILSIRLTEKRKAIKINNGLGVRSRAKARGKIPFQGRNKVKKVPERAVSSVVEQETLNLLVGGSNPSRPIFQPLQKGRILP